jgi:hypothetical protein
VSAVRAQHTRGLFEGRAVWFERRGGRDLGGARAGRPADVCGQDQGGDAAGAVPGVAGGPDGGGRVDPGVAHVLGAAHPLRHGAGDRGDVRVQGRVEGLVVGGVVAHEVEHGRAGAPGVVQVREPVAEAGAEVQQGRGRPPGHPPVSVGGAGRPALEQAQDAARLGPAVHGGDEVHLGRARIGEAELHAAAREGREDRLGAARRGHRTPPFTGRAAGPGAAGRPGDQGSGSGVVRG